MKPCGIEGLCLALMCSVEDAAFSYHNKTYAGCMASGSFKLKQVAHLAAC